MLCERLLESGWSRGRPGTISTVACEVARSRHPALRAGAARHPRLPSEPINASAPPEELADAAS